MHEPSMPEAMSSADLVKELTSNASLLVQRQIKLAKIEAKHEIQPATIRQGLASVLPKYMLPTVFRQMETLPRNPNGKIDRQGLTSLLARTQLSYVETPSSSERMSSAGTPCAAT